MSTLPLRSTATATEDLRPAAPGGVRARLEALSAAIVEVLDGAVAREMAGVVGAGAGATLAAGAELGLPGTAAGVVAGGTALWGLHAQLATSLAARLGRRQDLAAARAEWRLARAAGEPIPVRPGLAEALRRSERAEERAAGRLLPDPGEGVDERLDARLWLGRARGRELWRQGHPVRPETLAVLLADSLLAAERQRAAEMQVARRAAGREGRRG